MKFTDDLAWLLQSKREASVEIQILQSRLFERDINLENLTFAVDYNWKLFTEYYLKLSSWLFSRNRERKFEKVEFERDTLSEVFPIMLAK